MTNKYPYIVHLTVVHKVPVAVVRCSVKYPEDFEADVPEKWKKVMKWINKWWLLIPLILLLWGILAGWEGFFSTWEGWLLLISLSALIAVSVYRARFFHFNEKQ